MTLRYPREGECIVFSEYSRLKTVIIDEKASRFEILAFESPTSFKRVTLELNLYYYNNILYRSKLIESLIEQFWGEVE
jgi:hypothetical protein